jgi:hypothetical protein
MDGTTVDGTGIIGYGEKSQMLPSPTPTKTKMLRFCEMSSCLENYTCAKYLYQSNTLRTFRSLRNFASFNDYNDEEKLPNNAIRSISLYTTRNDPLKRVSYHSVTYPSRCTIHDPLKKDNLLFRYPVPLNSVFSIFARPLPLTSVSPTIFSSVAKFFVPNWGI